MNNHCVEETNKQQQHFFFHEYILISHTVHNAFRFENNFPRYLNLNPEKKRGPDNS